MTSVQKTPRFTNRYIRCTMIYGDIGFSQCKIWTGVGLGRVHGYPRFGSGGPITRVQIYYPLPECLL